MKKILFFILSFSILIPLCNASDMCNYYDDECHAVESKLDYAMYIYNNYHYDNFTGICIRPQIKITDTRYTTYYVFFTDYEVTENTGNYGGIKPLGNFMFCQVDERVVDGVLKPRTLSNCNFKDNTGGSSYCNNPINEGSDPFLKVDYSTVDIIINNTEYFKKNITLEEILHLPAEEPEQTVSSSISINDLSPYLIAIGMCVLLVFLAILFKGV